MKRLLLLVTFLFAMGSSFAQTTLINPSGNGGFENGATFTANGWTDVNHTTNAWYVGTVSAVSGNGAYVSNDLGVTNAYTNTAAQVSHFYTDITFPAGETYIYLNFDLKCEGEGTTTIWDALKIYLVTTSTTPVAGTSLASGQLGKSLNLTGGGFVKVNVQVPASFAGTTSRLVFSWVNDGSGGTNPPATVDNISLVSANLPALSGTYTIDNTLPTGGTNFKSFSEAFVALNAAGISGAVTFNVTAGQTFAENPPVLTATGTSTNTIIFQKSGAGANPIISASGFGTRSTTSTNVALNDIAVLIFGGDYITFDGIDVTNTSNQLEGGYGIANASGTDGGQYNIIKNSVVNLGLNNTINNTQTRAYRIVTPTAATVAAGANSYNTFQNIVSQNTYWGIFLYGTSATLPDINNLLTALPSFTSPLIGATPGYNDIGNTTVSQSSGFRAVEINAQQGFIIEKTEIRNMQNTNLTTTSDFAGFLVNSSITASSKNITFRNNLIHDLLSLSTGAQTVYGIWVNGNAIAASSFFDVYNSKIYKITAAVLGSSGTVRGILMNMTAATQTLNIYNNYIYQLYNPTSTASNYAVRCLELNSVVGTANVYSNTFYLDAPTTLTGTSAFATACIYMATSTSTILDMRNNILVNMSQVTAGTSSRAICFAKTTATIGTQIAATTDRNLLYAGTPSAQRLIAYDAVTGYQTIPTYQAWLTAPRELNAKTELPPFVSTSGTYDLHISPSVPTKVEGNASVTTLVTTDYDGNLRNATTPDIGADEGTFTAQLANDIAVTAIITPTNGITLPVGSTFDPQVSYFNNGSANQTAVPVRFQLIGPSPSTAVVVDLTSSIPTLNADASANVTFTTVNTTGFTAGTYTFKGRAELVGDGFAPNDEITGTLILAAPLSGTYLVGSSQTAPFNTLTNAIARLNGVGVSGPVIFELTDATYSETFPITINAFPGASSTNTFTIKPASSTTTVISGSSASSIIKLNGADYVTIDGSNAGTNSRDLTISNTATTSNSTGIWLSSLGVGLGASNNIIKNVIITCGVNQATTTTTTYGIIASSTAIPGSGADNDNNTYQNNYIHTVRYGIWSQGEVSTNPNNGTIISSNLIGPASFGANSIGKGGVVLQNETNANVSLNEIRYIGGDYANTSSGTDRVGITFGTDASWTPTSAFVTNSTISRNLIHDVIDERTFSAVGISIGAADGTNNTSNIVTNNIIYNIKCNGTSSDRAVGIGINAGKGDVIANNSIYMYGDADPNATATATGMSAYGIAIGSTSVVNVTMQNNIAFMDLTSSSAPSILNYCISIPASYTWGTGLSNYNDLWYLASNTQSRTGIIGTTSYQTLVDWQTASTQDANSLQVDPLFQGISDLHINTGTGYDAIPMITRKGTPLASVTVDYDGDARDVSKPDIGADEFLVNRTLITNGSFPSGLVDNLTLNGSGINAALAGNLEIVNTLTMTDGLLTLGGSSVTTSALSGGSASSFVVTDGAGLLTVQNVSNSDILFPVGSSSTSFTPAKLNNSGTPDGFSVKVQDAIDNPGFDPNGVINKQWTINESVAGGSNVAITLQWNAINEHPNFVRTNQLYIKRWNGASYDQAAGTAVAGSDPYSTTASGFSSFSPFIVECDNPLPMELTAFTAIPKGRDIVLNWQTTTEVNSAMFEIQRSKENTSEWTSIGKVNAAGNSNSPLNYSFTDNKLSSGKFNYRLKMVDADGSYSFSSVVESEVELPKEYAISQNYPNPFNPSTRIDYQLPFDSKVTLEVYGITGEKVATIINTELSAGYYTADVNAGSLNLASGMYIYRIVAVGANNQNFTQVKKLMLTK